MDNNIKLIEASEKFFGNYVWKKFKIMSLALFSIIVTYLLIGQVWEIGDYTSRYGDQFGVSYIFSITNKEKDGERFKVRKSPTTRQNNVYQERTDIGQAYLYRGKTKVGSNVWIEVDPVYRSVKPGGELVDISRRKIDSIEEFFGEGKSGYITDLAGEIMSPFEFNVERFLNKKGIKNQENYDLGRLIRFFAVRNHIVYIYGFFLIDFVR